MNSSIFKTVISRNYSLSSCMKIAVKPQQAQKEASIESIKSKYKSSNKKKNENEVPSGGWLLLVRLKVIAADSFIFINKLYFIFQVIPVSTLALGVWQVYRWRWKLGLIEEMRMKSIADPIPLPDE